MATSIQAAIPKVAPHVDIPTPRWLSRAVVLVWLFGLAFVVMSILAVREHRAALEAIANHSARSVIAAETIAAELANMDASAANGLLNPQGKDSSVAEFDASRGRMTSALIDAARNLAFEGEEAEIKALAKNSGVYSERVGAAFTLQNGSAAATLQKYLSAAQLLDTTLMPGARNLDKINRDELDFGFKSIGVSSTIQTALVWLAGLGMLGVLLRIQFFLSERMRRTLNPLVLTASLLIFGMLVYTQHALSTASHEISVIKADAFESIHSLWQAKAVASEANAQESRYLLDKQGAGAHQDRFYVLAALVSNSPEELRAGLKKGRPSPNAKGYLADELRNLTFQGEREAAFQAVEAWAKYVEIDKQIRAYERSGQHDRALQLCLGEGEGESNWAFNRFVKAMNEVLRINQEEFEKSAALGFQVLQHFEGVALVVGLLAMIACLFGVLPRIREYSA